MKYITATRKFLVYVITTIDMLRELGKSTSHLGNHLNQKLTNGRKMSVLTS